MMYIKYQIVGKWFEETYEAKTEDEINWDISRNEAIFSFAKINRKKPHSKTYEYDADGNVTKITVKVMEQMYREKTTFHDTDSVSEMLELFYKIVEPETQGGTIRIVDIWTDSEHLRALV